MRSDFYSLPWAAQQAIQRGEHDAAVARRRAMDISDLRAKVDELEKQLAEANETIAALRSKGGEG